MMSSTDTHQRHNNLVEASPLQRDILRTLLYFDIFNHPLTPAEILAYLPSNSTDPQAILQACRSFPLRRMLHEDGGYFCLSQTASMERQEKELRARTFLKIAKFMTGIIRRFPFVRGVFLSGELSKGVMGKDGDIDFFIVAADNRLWVARSLLILFKKLVLFNRKKYFCLNHFITESYFDVPLQNIYTAVEIASLKPLFNLPLHRAYICSNAWITSYFPNFVPPEPSPGAVPRVSLMQKLFELPFLGRWGDILDDRLMALWKSTWKRRYRSINLEKRNTLFRSEKYISTAYGGDFLSRILSAYASRLRSFGLEERT